LSGQPNESLLVAVYQNDPALFGFTTLPGEQLMVLITIVVGTTINTALSFLLFISTISGWW
jgi:hypothetical protein